MGEFDLIRRYFDPVAREQGHPDLRLALGDDCAILRVPPGRDLVFSMDTLVEGVHFPRAYPAERLAWRALAAAASDLAAMGADPVCFTLALTIPRSEERWLAAFAQGLSEAARSFGLALAGGDTTRGPLTVTLQVQGTVPQDQALRRDGAAVGDLIVVSGTLGDAAAALAYLDERSPSEDARALLARYHRPVPRLALGQALRGIASAAIDVSDGLGADLQHLLSRSGVGACLDLSQLPLSPALRRCRGPEASHLAWCGGDDYELCVTLPETGWHRLAPAVRAQLTPIGRVESKPGLRFQEGTPEPDGSAGFDHFRSEDG
ncbi:thiamine-phosphate kinase [Marinobacter lutaoensis]|jgi:thiamine-monophosphate kinase|uniref:Thiamine-monophosphate kinase n=1 Tax=Marinobacter lutaoensis TaxID=135739 RepID=A0A1V2DW43_9GAMM|nr:thiamine-phosphate kinase [Marinobacter lutaoensis]NVD35600.1 thiamine-phosphate kinase [Marinobacter lutaoensis]ONF44709.1 thiamine-phosphate kinase [Marinobacter lutaoensis]